MKAISHEVRVEKSSMKDDIIRTQRQRLRKVGLFAADIPSSSSDTRVRYAGAWEPNSTKQNEQATEDETQTNSSESKQVIRKLENFRPYFNLINFSDFK